MSGKTWIRLSPGPDTRKAFVPNLATFCIMTKPFHTLVSFALLVAFEKSGVVLRESGDLKKEMFNNNDFKEEQFGTDTIFMYK